MSDEKIERTDSVPRPVNALVRPWIGKLHHARGPCDDWGCIRDESGECIMRVCLPTWNESVLNEHRRNKTDPTQKRMDAILSLLNAPNARLESRRAEQGEP